MKENKIRNLYDLENDCFQFDTIAVNQSFKPVVSLINKEKQEMLIIGENLADDFISRKIEAGKYEISFIFGKSVNGKTWRQIQSIVKID